jgi:hypothetical protein
MVFRGIPVHVPPLGAGAPTVIPAVTDFTAHVATTSSSVHAPD